MSENAVVAICLLTIALLYGIYVAGVILGW